MNFVRALGALVFVIFIFGMLMWMFEKRDNKQEFDKGLKGIWEGFWWSAVTMTTVGYGDKAPLSFGGRVIALVWMFAAIIIISGFTASIASSLTLESSSSPSHERMQPTNPPNEPTKKKKKKRKEIHQCVIGWGGDKALPTFFTEACASPCPRRRRGAAAG